MDKRPKRRKDKYNPYTLHTENEKNYVLFIDVNNHIQKVEVSKKIFDSFNKFELELSLFRLAVKLIIRKFNRVTVAALIFRIC